MQSLVVHIINRFNFNVFCIVVVLDVLNYFIFKFFCTNPHNTEWAISTKCCTSDQCLVKLCFMLFFSDFFWIVMALNFSICISSRYQRSETYYFLYMCACNQLCWRLTSALGNSVSQIYLAFHVLTKLMELIGNMINLLLNLWNWLETW